MAQDNNNRQQQPARELTRVYGVEARFFAQALRHDIHLVNDTIDEVSVQEGVTPEDLIIEVFKACAGSECFLVQPSLVDNTINLRQRVLVGTTSNDIQVLNHIARLAPTGLGVLNKAAGPDAPLGLLQWGANALNAALELGLRSCPEGLHNGYGNVALGTNRQTNEKELRIYGASITVVEGDLKKIHEAQGIANMANRTVYIEKLLKYLGGVLPEKGKGEEPLRKALAEVESVNAPWAVVPKSDLTELLRWYSFHQNVTGPWAARLKAFDLRAQEETRAPARTSSRTIVAKAAEEAAEASDEDIPF
jgi:hypothetical protein